MARTRSKAPVKKTVVINPLLDEYIRKTWAILID